MPHSLQFIHNFIERNERFEHQKILVVPVIELKKIYIQTTNNTNIFFILLKNIQNRKGKLFQFRINYWSDFYGNYI